MQITRKDKDSKNNDKKRFSSFLINYEQQDKMTSKLKRFFSSLVIKTEYQNKVINSDFNAKKDLWNTFTALSHTDKSIMQYKYCCKLKQLWCSKQPFNLVREDKVYFEVLINTGITYDQQNCFMVSIYDITSQFKFQQSQRMNLFKSKLLKSITHELRTRLNIVQGILELLQLKNLQQADLTNVHYAYNNCKIQSHIVGSIVDYNLLQDGNIEPKNTLKDVREVIQDLNKLFFEECEMKQIRIEIYFECFNYDLVTDIERLMQVLINIMSNAVKYTDEKGFIEITVSKNSRVPLDQHSNRKHRLSVRVKEGELRQDKLSIDRFPILFDPIIDEILEGTNYYVIAIKDTGQGIPKEKLKMIENMFENNDNAIFSDDDKAQGFMLGLRSSCALLKFINNDFSQNWLKITSDCDYGTQIYLIVIIHEIKDPNESKRNYKKQLSQEHLSSGLISPIVQYETDSQFRIQSENKVRLVYQLKINDVFIKKTQKCSCKHNEVMIVDDEPFNLLVLEVMLKIYGLKAQRANNGQEFIQLFKKKIQQCENLYCRTYRFVIMDYQMPILNGASATQQALALCRSQNRRDIIVIGCTAFSDQNDIQDLKTSGMKLIFIKPITRKKIQEMIEFVDTIHAD